uniref:Uncharacterized protein n=1 Tax=Micrurus lemniscatus lemniscatus TaxID=129467 RepID=A0A2D4H622_MICLE
MQSYMSVEILIQVRVVLKVLFQKEIELFCFFLEDFTSHLRKKVTVLNTAKSTLKEGSKRSSVLKLNSPLNSRQGIRHHLSPVYKAVLSTVPRRFHNQMAQ